MSEQFDPRKIEMSVDGTTIEGYAEGGDIFVDREDDFKFKPEGETCSRCKKPMVRGEYETKRPLREYGSPGYGLQFPEGRHSLRYWACTECDTK
jgi:hypothetical protein